MRISLLEKRENFHLILKETLNKSSFFKDKSKNIKQEKFIVNRYLNFIATQKIKTNVFQNLVNEYSNALVWWKKIIQKTYVHLAVSKVFRKFFGNKIIELSANFGEFLILGGNHRLRLFSKDLSFSVLLLKENERIGYVANDISIRTNQTLSYAPIVFESGKDWLKEEYFAGIPLNRLEGQDEIESYQEKAIKLHLEELLMLTIKQCTKSEYAAFVKDELALIINNKSIQNTAIKSDTITSLLDLLLNKITTNSISISWSHGDFQMANILIRDKNFKVIDWESADKRYYLYDLFILLGKVRTNISLKESIENFKNKILLFLDVTITPDIITLLLIEELRFSVNEEYSENFYISGIKTKQICESIQEYINE
jgi:hypothetical protein